MGTQSDRGFTAATRVLVVNADPALFGLIEEWLVAAGHEVTSMSAGEEPPSGRVDLVIIDIPFPRRGGLDLLRQVAADHPGTPVLALSSTFLAGTGSRGAVARTLGVAGVLPNPVSREALIAAVGDLLVATT